MKMKTKNIEKVSFITVLSIALISLGVFISGYLFYNYLKENTIKQHFQRLQSINNHKINQILAWKSERFADADFFFRNISFREKVEKILLSQNTDIINNTKSWLLQLKANHDYSSITLFDKNYNIITSTNENYQADYYDSISIQKAVEKEKVLLSDFYLEPFSNRTFINLTVPIIKTIANVDYVLAILIFRIDPYQQLYKIIEEWPDPQSSLETFLLKVEGDTVIYLSELKYRTNAPLRFKITDSDTTTTPVKAKIGIIGTCTGKDYRGVEVFSVIDKIEGTNWIIMSEIDESEALMSVQLQRIFIAVVALGIILILSLFYFLTRRKKVTEEYKKLYEAEAEKKLYAEKYEILTKFANDIIILSDEYGNIVDANQKALEEYGYTYAEITKMKMNEVRAKEEALTTKQLLQLIEEKGGRTFQTVHQRKDGSTFPVEVSVNKIIIGNQKYYLGIIRDITKRKNYEEQLIKSREYYKLILETFPSLIFQTDTNNQATYFNSTWFNFTGAKVEEINGNGWKNYVHPEDLPTLETELKKCWQQKTPLSTEFRLKHFTNQYRWVTISGIPLYNVEEEYIGFIYACKDENEKKEYLQRLTKLNKIYSVQSEINQAIVRTRNKKTLFEEIIKVLINIGKIDACWIGSYNRLNSQISPEAIHFNGSNTPSDNEILYQLPNEVLYEINQANYFLCNHLDECRQEHPYADFLASKDIKAFAIFPLTRGVLPSGIIALYTKEENRFDEEELKLFKELANDISFAITFYDEEEKKIVYQTLLQKANEKLNAIIEASPLAIITIDMYGTILSWNPSAEKMFHQKAEDNIGKQLSKISTSYFALFEQVKSEIGVIDKSKEYEFDIELLDGTPISILVNVAPLRNERKEINGILIMAMDITERKKIQAELEYNAQFIQKITNAIPLSIYIYDIIRHTNVYSNNKITELLGYSPEEVENMGAELLANLMHPDDFKNLPKTFSRFDIAKDNEILEAEYRMKAKSGEYIWIHSYETVFQRTPDGKPAQILGVAENISSRKLAEEAAEFERNKLISILENLPDGVYIINPNFEITYANKHIIEQYGPLNGPTPCYKYFHNTEEVCQWCKNKENFFAETYQIEFFAENKGEYYELISILLHNKDGTIERLEVQRNITERKIAEEKLKNINRELEIKVEERTQALERALEAIQREVEERKIIEKELLHKNKELVNLYKKEKELNELKNHFISLVSHEFRTPLMSILGGVNLISTYRDKMPIEKQDEYLKDIEDSVNKLVTLLNEVLFISKAEVEKISVKLTTINIEQYFNNVIHNLQLSYPNRKINIKLNAENPTVQLDGNLLDNIIFNLLTNALKYSAEDKPVDLEINVSEQLLEIKVRDYGIGIPKKDQDKVFEAFSRATNVNSVQGTGLGLTIVKRSVDLLQGNIYFESELNKGSTFYVTLPLNL